ncbi:MAG: AAA family ATPase, partial [Nannocystaceae bacterium]
MLPSPPSLDRYELTERIYQGDASVVYRGRRLADGAAVTIKVPRSDRPRPRSIATLRHEYNLLRELDVPGVIRVIALEEYGEGVALVEEAAPGATLSRLISHGALPLAAGLRVARGLARSLHGLHEAGVVHKDIKPQNILVSSETLETHLIDFGIATRLTHASAWQSRPEHLEGTLAYMSPEQTGRTNRVIDPRSDLYSLGVTLYELFTGALPFTTDDVMELVHCHIAREPTPPHEVVRTLPRAVSAIILRLLAKAPEDRYQTSRGLLHDLEFCLDQLAETGMIAEFPLGTDDRSAVLRIHRELYGRDEEIATLGAAFGRICSGRPELALISGYSGVGKSALIFALHRAIAAAGGWLVAGKFDLYDRGTPYAPIAAAMGMLVRQLLGEREESLARWRERILRALGRNAGLLLPLVPELELVIGPQPEPDELTGDAARNRFLLTFVSFLCTFATAERPLVLFLDDLQWVDAASLKLLEHVMSAGEEAHLLVIGAYRDNEVDDAHPLKHAADRLRDSGALGVELTLTPLEEPLIRRWLADTLHHPEEALEGLSALVHAKTRGNPFFVTVFLRALYEEGLLRFDADARAWVWDLEAIAVAGVTDNVADLLAAKLVGLPEATLDAVKRAACLGHTFLLDTLATIAGCSVAAAAERLNPAIDAGMIVALDAGHRLLAAEAQSAGEAHLDIAVRYRFLHDRVHQAAYSLIGADERSSWHLAIGRLLRAELEATPADDALFECVRHLNLGAALIDAPDERRASAALDLEAGRRARRGAAFTAAAALLAAGRELLGEEGWSRDHGLTFALHRDQAEAEAMNGDFAASEALALAAIDHAKGRQEKVEIGSIRLLTRLRHGDAQGAYVVGLEICRLYDIEIPSDLPSIYAATGGALQEVDALLAGRPLAELLERPPLTDPELLALQSFLIHFSGVVFVANRAAFGIPTLAALMISLRHGHSQWSAHAYASYASLLAAGLHRYADAR